VSYLGYFDPYKCYDYDKTIISSTADGTRGAFVPAGATNAFHECRGKWSGSYLNWAAAHSIDGFRSLMTGGNRSVDTPTTTILEKARFTGIKNSRNASTKRIGGDSFTQREVTVMPVDRSTVTPYPSRANSPLYTTLSAGVSHPADGFQLLVSDTDDFASSEKFYVRVKVCDKRFGLEKNCKKVGSSFKPAGLIQDSNQAVRFGVFSYLLDNSMSRAGGVLRARMKETGPKKYIPGNGSVINPRAEWSAIDGTFISNPDPADAAASGVHNSGVINYLNKFGRVYGHKEYDPVSELYYENLKYFRNLAPTPEYISNITPAMKEDFPVITDWDDPIQFSCQRNFILTLGDTSSWCDTLVPGNTFSDACSGHAGSPSGGDKEIDVKALTDKVGSLEGINNLALASQGPVQLGSYFIAGLAYWANTHDIRPDIATKPQTKGKQTVQSFFIRLAGHFRPDGKDQFWLGAKYGGFDDINNDGKPANDSTFDKDGDHVPDNYFSGLRPEQITDALHKIFAIITNPSGADAGISIGNPNFDGRLTSSSVYQTFFTSCGVER
jgi:type IV pilus assembly protein PilY1